MQVFQGNLVWSQGPKELIFRENGLVGVSSNGKIAFVAESKDLEQLKTQYKFSEITRLDADQFLIPGFVDTHIHAPQYVYTGTGYDKPLLEWLNTYTFPREAEFKSNDYASDAFEKAVKRTLSCGTTTACYFGTIHLDACKILAEKLAQNGQRAFIGKVNMDRNSPDYYIETTEDSKKSTLEFVEYMKNLNNPLLTAVITPRFVPSCTPDLMQFLGQLADKYNLPIQSHISENKDEIEWVKSLHPDCGNYAKVYQKYGLFNQNTLMAHCVHLEKEEIEMFKEFQVGVSHCPTSNFCLQSGVCNVRLLLNEGIIKIGLGTDVGGGYSPCILDSMRQAATASKVVAMENGNSQLDLGELIYLATLGGARVLGLQDRIGSFQVGKDFDALLISLDQPNIHLFAHDDFKSRVEKFVYLGDDRNISRVFVKGSRVI